MDEFIINTMSIIYVDRDKKNSIIVALCALCKTKYINNPKYIVKGLYEQIK